MNKEQIQNIGKIILSYLLSFTQTLIITPLIFIFLAPLIMFLFVVQENISFEISSKIFYVLFLGQGLEDESNLFLYYIVYASVFSFILEIINFIYKKRIIFKLRHKLIVSFTYFFIAYLLAAVFFAIFQESAFSVMLFLLIFSLIYSSIAISISHGLSELKKRMHSSYINQEGKLS